MEATVLPSNTVDNGSWHFNATGVPGAIIGSPRKLAVWITAEDVGFHVLGTPVTFNCCDATASGCSSAPCLSAAAPGAPGICAELTVIRTIAPRAYRVELDAAVINLAQAVRGGGGFQLPRMVLEYSLDLSTHARAVWAGRGLAAGAALHLAVVRSSCGGLCADLTLQRLVPKGVAAPIVWESVTFDLLKGGTFIAAQGDACGSMLLVTPERDGADRAASRPARESRQQKQPNRRASRR